MSSTNALSCKIVLLGESGVGKTSIISRYVNNIFNSNFIPTLGSCYAAKQVFFKDYEKNIKFEIWDTAGQEKYRSIIKIFYKDANVAILVYDISRRESFEELKNYWYQEICLVFSVAANKSDLYEYNDLVPDEEGREFAKGIGAIFIETSAKSASGIDDLFHLVGLKLINPDFNTENTNNDETLMNIRIRKNLNLNEAPKKLKKEKKNCC